MEEKMHKYRVCHLPAIRGQYPPEGRDVEYWLNTMAEDGYEFVSFASHTLSGHYSPISQWWIFRKEE
jgi:hypothetical protein